MGVILDVLWSQTEVRLGLLVAVGLAVLVGVWTSQRGRPWVAPAGLTLSSGVVVAVALSGLAVAHSGAGFSWWSQCRFGGPTRLLSDVASSQGIANIAIFVPVGLFAAALHGRVRAGVVVGLALSLFVEVIQGLTWGRDCSSTDLATNVAGAFIGAILFQTGAVLRGGRTPIGGPPPAVRQP